MTAPANEPMVVVTRAVCLACGLEARSFEDGDRGSLPLPAVVSAARVRDASHIGHTIDGERSLCYGQVQIEMEPAHGPGGPR